MLFPLTAPLLFVDDEERAVIVAGLFQGDVAFHVSTAAADPLVHGSACQHEATTRILGVQQTESTTQQTDVGEGVEPGVEVGKEWLSVIDRTLDCAVDEGSAVARLSKPRRANALSNDIVPVLLSPMPKMRARSGRISGLFRPSMARQR